MNKSKKISPLCDYKKLHSGADFLKKTDRLIKSLACAFIFTLIFQSLSLYGECLGIEKNTFRLHILANSDSREDQTLKLQLRDAVLKYTENMFQSADTSHNAERLVKKKMAEISCFSQKFIQSKGYDYAVNMQITNMYFTTRVYENFTLPAGYYDALRIVIGSGNGHNWWCVMFPQLCLPSAENKSDKIYTEGQNELIKGGVKYEYKFKIVEWYQNIVNFFNGNR